MISREAALSRAASIRDHLNAARREILWFLRDKGHVALGYADTTAGKRQCAHEQFGRSLSWFYRQAQEAEMEQLSPACENLSGRALRELAKLQTDVALATVEVAKVANGGKVTESAIRHAAENVKDVLATGAYRDANGGQVTVRDLQVAGTAEAIMEAKARHIASLAKRNYLISNTPAIIQDARTTKGKLYLLVELTPDDLPDADQLKADGQQGVFIAVWQTSVSGGTAE